MASWSQATSAQHNDLPAAGPARPLTYLLSAGSGSLIEHALLVRLRVDVPAAAAALAHAQEETDDEELAAQQAQDAACAVGQLHNVIRGIEQASEDARLSAVLELLQDKTLQLLCSKAVVAKVYKSLMLHKAAVGFTLASVKECLSQKPVASWDLQESLQTAIIKTLTGCSSGTASTSSAAASSADPGDSTALQAAAASQAAGGKEWMCLSRHKLVGANLLAAAPGQVSTAAIVELDSKLDANSEGLLLIFHAAGSVKFRPFSPMQALHQDPKALRGPLTLADTDADLLADSSKLVAAARQLDGRAVKLLPDERLAFIKGLSAAPTEPQQLQQLQQLWLGSCGLQLPVCFPFMLGVATQPEAEAAQMQVPSCCVLTNLGLSSVPGSHTSAVSRLLSDLQAAAAAYSFWGHKLTVQLKDAGQAGAAAGLTQGNLLLTQGQDPTQLAGAGAGAGAGAVQFKTYSIQTAWTSAAELFQLHSDAKQQAVAAAGAGGADKQAAAAAAAKGQVGVPALTAAGAQLMGLLEAEDTTYCCHTNATQHNSSHRRQQQGVLGASSGNKQRWQQLKSFLDARQAQQQQQQGSVGLLGCNTTSRVPPTASVSSARALSSSSSGSTAPAAAAARVAAGRSAAPVFGSRRPGASKPPAARKAAGAVKKPAGTGAALAAALAAQAATAGAGSEGGGAPAGPAAAAAAEGGPAKAQPALGKRPGKAAAAAKPPAAKKPKAAAAAGTAASAKPKNAKKAAAAATTAAAGPAAAAVAVAAPAAPAAGADVPAAAAEGPASMAAATAEGVGSQPAAAESAAAAAEQQQQRKRTKATYLDLAAVTAKVQAAFAASGGAALKGVTVPEVQCYLKAQGVKGGSAKRADVEARLLALLT